MTALTVTEGNDQFYPTPEDVAEKMLDGLDWRMITCVLEPSAGKGNLVEAAMRMTAEVDLLEVLKQADAEGQATHGFVWNCRNHDCPLKQEEDRADYEQEVKRALTADENRKNGADVDALRQCRRNARVNSRVAANIARVGAAKYSQWELGYEPIPYNIYAMLMKVFGAGGDENDKASTD
jgi:hypothetical protein